MIAVPALRCAHCGETHALRCFYYKRQGRYCAECVDLDLLSLGKTPEEAIARLQEAMLGYLQVAFEGPSTKGLVLRPSPLGHRIYYHWRRLLGFVRRIIEREHKHLLPEPPSTNTFCRLSHS